MASFFSFFGGPILFPECDQSGKLDVKAFLSAAQPTDQGTESVLVVVVVVGTHSISTEVQFFGV